MMRAGGHQTMQKTKVILLSDDPRTAGTMRLLLSDWGFEAIPRALSAELSEDMLQGDGAVGIICDIVHADIATAIRAALVLRERLRPDLPILISTNAPPAADAVPLPPLVNILAKPAHPCLICNWVEDHRRKARAACQGPHA